MLPKGNSDDTVMSRFDEMVCKGMDLDGTVARKIMVVDE
jgi:hypothetical protein